jgi:hypothetical protein
LCRCVEKDRNRRARSLGRFDRKDGRKKWSGGYVPPKTMSPTRSRRCAALCSAVSTAQPVLNHRHVSVPAGCCCTACVVCAWVRWFCIGSCVETRETHFFFSFWDAVQDAMSGELASERWSPAQRIRTILLSVISLLNEPNTSSPVSGMEPSVLDPNLSCSRHPIHASIARFLPSNGPEFRAMATLVLHTMLTVVLYPACSRRMWTRLSHTEPGKRARAPCIKPVLRLQ